MSPKLKLIRSFICFGSLLVVSVLLIFSSGFLDRDCSKTNGELRKKEAWSNKAIQSSGNLTDEEDRSNNGLQTGSTCGTQFTLYIDNEVDKVGKNTTSDILNTRIDRWIQNAEFMLHCPDLFETLNADRVPNLVHRIWECEEVPLEYVPALNTWIENMEDVFVFFWTSELRLKFVLQHGTKEQLSAYKRIRPGAFKADFFRYLVMYRFGGVYSDIDTYLQVNLSPRKELDYLYSLGSSTVAHDISSTRLLNGAILMALPGQPIFRCAIGEVVDHVERKKTDLDGLDITGPGVLGECARHVLGLDDLDFGKDVLDVSSTGLHILPSLWLPDGSGHAVLLENNIFIRMMQGGAPYPRRGVSPNCDPGEHYTVLHSKNMLYNNVQ